MLETNIQLDITSAEAQSRFPEQTQMSFQERATSLIDGYKTWAEQYPFAATAIETTALYAVRQVASKLGQRVGIKTGNAMKERHHETIARHPIMGAVHAGVLAPLAEELVYRGVLDVPGQCAEVANKPGTARAIRSITSLGFAAGHAGYVRPANEWPKAPFIKVGKEGTTVPIEQFMGGLNYSRLRKNRGFKHALAAHALNNTIATASAIPSIRRRRK